MKQSEDAVCRVLNMFGSNLRLATALEAIS